MVGSVDSGLDCGLSKNKPQIGQLLQFWKSSKRFWIPVEVFLAPPPLDQAAPPFLSFTCSNPSGVWKSRLSSLSSRGKLTVSTEAPRVGNSATESTLISLFLRPKAPGKPELLKDAWESCLPLRTKNKTSMIRTRVVHAWQEPQLFGREERIFSAGCP